MVTQSSFKLRDDFVELFKLLKIEGLASSGAEAKNFVSAGLVKVNGEVELRKRKKLFAGDMVNFADHQIEIKT